MSLYTPNTVPTKVEDIPDFLEVEVDELQRAINVKEFLKLEETNVDPFRPQNGEIRFADGVNWDPGSGRGMYWYDGDVAAWVAFAGGAAGCWSCIETRSVSSGQFVDFDLPTGFDMFVLWFFGLRPASNDQELRSQLSNDGGSTFLGGTGYRTSPHGADSNGVETTTGNSQNGDHWTLTLGTDAGKGVDTASPAGASGHIEIMHARDPANRTRFTGRTAFENAANGAQLLWNVTTGGVHTTAEVHDAIRLFWFAGDHEAGDYILTGLKGP